MPAPLAAAGYRGVVQMLMSASRGSYRGPAVPVDAVAQALGSTEGLDPGKLVDHTRAAVGLSGTSGMRGGLVESLFTFLAQAAFGEILGRVVDNLNDWFTNRDESGDVARDAEDAGESLQDIEDVADTGIEEILVALRAVIGQLCTFLNQLDPALHPREFGECVAAGADLIDSAGGTILDCCRDRDTAVTSCLDEFLARGTAVCERPACGAHTEVGCGEQAAATPGVPAARAEPDVRGDAPTFPQSVASEPAPPEPSTPPGKSVQPTPPEKPAEPPTVPQTTEPVDEEAPAPESTAEPAEPEEVAPDEAQTTGCCGVLGLVGAGVALLGVGLLVSTLEDCAPASAPTPEPEPVPESVPEPPPPPKQDLADVPEPPPPPKQDLAEVPEPPPPPKQTPVQVEPAAAAPQPAAPQPVAAQTTTPESPPAPAPAPGGARKAGEW